MVLPNCTATVKRTTAYVLDSIAVAGSLSASRQPARASTIQVELAGSGPTGTVTIAGTVNGQADTETLTWTGAAVPQVTTKKFTAISGITTSLSGATTISAQATGGGGGPATQSYALKSGHPMRRHVWGTSGWKPTAPGVQRVEGATFLIQYEDTWAPRQGDLVVVDGTSEAYEVVGVQPVGGTMVPDHWKVTAELRQGR